MFLSYINDLTDDLESCPFIFADDTTLFEVVNNPIDFGQLLNDDLTKISRLLVTMNPLKNPTYDCFEKERKAKSGCDIEEVDIYTHLGLTFQNNMSWNSHTFSIYEKVYESH